MIAFKYTKIDGAEFISHLDTLRHIDRTLRRANIEIKKSEGFNKHPRIFMNNPLATGVCSQAEYCAVDTDFNGDFMQAFNDNSPKGIKCLKWQYTATNPNFANSITACSYRFEGISPFNIAELMDETSIVITDLRGRQVDIRPRIYAIERSGDEIFCTLGCGENNLRCDLFCDFLAERYGGNAKNIIKIQSLGEGVF